MIAAVITKPDEPEDKTLRDIIPCVFKEQVYQ